MNPLLISGYSVYFVGCYNCNYCRVVLFAQIEHDQYVHHEREKLIKAEEADAAEKLNNILKVRVAELEANLEKCLAEKIELQARVEKATLSSGRICVF